MQRFCRLKGFHQVLKLFLKNRGRLHRAGQLRELLVECRRDLLELLLKPAHRLETAGQMLEDGINEIIIRRKLPCRLARVGSMWTLFFTSGRVDNWSQAAAADTARFATYFQRMLEAGVLLAPSQFEANFLSAAHTSADIAAIVLAAETALEIACA